MSVAFVKGQGYTGILLKNPMNASTKLSMNGKSPMISQAPPFVLRLSKDERKVFQQSLLRTYMGNRFATSIIVLVFLLSSAAFACPNVYSFPTVTHHSSPDGKMPDRDLCGNTDKKASPSTCYRALHHRVFQLATISGPPGGQGAPFVAVEDSVLSGPVFSAQLPAWRSKSSPKLPLTVLFPVLRI